MEYALTNKLIGLLVRREPPSGGDLFVCLFVGSDQNV